MASIPTPLLLVDIFGSYLHRFPSRVSPCNEIAISAVRHFLMAPLPELVQAVESSAWGGGELPPPRLARSLAKAGETAQAALVAHAPSKEGLVSWTFDRESGEGAEAQLLDGRWILRIPVSVRPSGVAEDGLPAIDAMLRRTFAGSIAGSALARAAAGQAIPDLRHLSQSASPRGISMFNAMFNAATLRELYDVAPGLEAMAERADMEAQIHRPRAPSRPETL